MSQFPTSVKDWAPIFTLDGFCDNRGEMLNPQAFDSEHPLSVDRERLDRILDVMYAKIQKTLIPKRIPGRRPRPETSLISDANGVERILDGTGVSADDVLSDAHVALLRYPPENLEGTWEGLAVTIARNKAVDAKRAAGKGLSGTAHRQQLHLVQGDAEREGPDGDTAPALLARLPSNWGDPEAECLTLEAVLKLRDLARELLDDRDQRVFFAIHFGGFTRREVGAQLGLTSRRIGQIYSAALLTLEAHQDYPFKPPITVGQLSEWRKL